MPRHACVAFAFVLGALAVGACQNPPPRLVSVTVAYHPPEAAPARIELPGLRLAVAHFTDDRGEKEIGALHDGGLTPVSARRVATLVTANDPALVAADALLSELRRASLSAAGAASGGPGAGLLADGVICGSLRMLRAGQDPPWAEAVTTGARDPLGAMRPRLDTTYRARAVLRVRLADARTGATVWSADVESLPVETRYSGAWDVFTAAPTAAVGEELSVLASAALSSAVDQVVADLQFRNALRRLARSAR